MVINIARMTWINNLSLSTAYYNFNFYLLIFTVWLAYAFAYRVSLAHLNPAITIVHMCRTDGNFNWIQGILYILIQPFGFGLGICAAWWFLRSAGSIHIYTETATNDDWYAESVGMEVAAGFIFALVHLLQTNPVTAISPNKLWQTAVIGMTYTTTLYWSFDRTGGSNNPAYGLSQTFIDLWDDGQKEAMRYTWIYCICPVVGALMAWPLYQIIYCKAHETAVSSDAVNKI
uniref:Aquaporin-like protein n=1 Tax=Euplotes harpa TaxID=151035 RepID=A0A7S3N7N5_9SPIT|mmetsp:Transcript_31125/g.35551  ORF Transcript_31125/g.35551 Transcript_31125/m.35551 type:complete len:231 (+) Transcript_31125:78-770(+)